MDINDLDKEFQKTETEIQKMKENNQDTSDLLRYKTRLLNIAYKQFSESITKNATKMTAPLYAKKLAFLNNIKEIQHEINDNTSYVDQEIKKIQNEMRENGLGWILDNLPEKKA